MNQYKIIASDLDGTLMSSDMSISEANLTAITELSRHGVFFVPASGRTMCEIPPILKDNSDIRYFIYSNGAAFYDKETDKRFVMSIPNEIVKYVFDVIHSYEVYITVRQNGESYVDSRHQNEADRKYYNVHIVHSKVMDEAATFMDNFTDFIYSLRDVESISIFFHDKNDIPKCKERLKAIGELLVADGWVDNLEIFFKEAGKGNCLHKLAEYAGVDIADTIGVGDSDNDATLIKAAGLGLAVSNAVDSIKEIADEIICSNNEGAIDHILKHYIVK